MASIIISSSIRLSFTLERCGLYDKNVRTTHVFLDLNKDFSIREVGQVPLAQRDADRLTDLFRQWKITSAAYQHKLAAYSGCHL